MRTVEEIMAEIESVSAETRPSACTEESFEKWRAWKRRGLKAELLDALTSCIPLDRLREMCEAEREQRCVVLPCKVGDTVYTTYISGSGLTREVVPIKFHLHNLSDFGKTVFLPRSDAEAALQSTRD